MPQTADSSTRDAEIVGPGENAVPSRGDPDERALQRLEAEEKAERLLVRRARRLGLILMILSVLASLALLSAAWLGLGDAF